MKKFMKMFGAAALLAGMMMAGGCGDDAAQTPQGRLVKGPVTGAIVTDVTGKEMTTQTVNGYFPAIGTGPYKSSGGKYFNLKADGSGYDTSVELNAPPLTAPIGTTQLTPLSTVCANASAADAKIITDALAAAGLSLNSDLSVPTVANKNTFALNESLGTILSSYVKDTTIYKPSLLQVNAAAASLVAAAKTAVGSNINASTVTPGTITTTLLTPAVLTAATTAANNAGTTQVPAVVTAALSSAATTMAATLGKVDPTKPFTVPTVTPVIPTGSTGSTGVIIK